MSNLTKETYEKQAAECDGLCVIQPARQDAEFMHCVTCPFCKEIVSARLTPKTISCPECKVVVAR